GGRERHGGGRGGAVLPGGEGGYLLDLDLDPDLDPDPRDPAPLSYPRRSPPSPVPAPPLVRRIRRQRPLRALVPRDDLPAAPLRDRSEGRLRVHDDGVPH